MKKKYEHTHKYQRVTFGNKGNYILRCMIVDCSHFLQPAMAVNRKSICWSCNHEFILSSLAVTREKPICQECVERRARSSQLSNLSVAEEVSE
jgi:formylmethanofuran dehydrogenase subunit E